MGHGRPGRAVPGRAGRAEHQAERLGKRLRADAQLRAELELCDRWGIPHSAFLGAGDGTWSAADRAKALAYRELDRQTCPDCGTRGEEWDEEAGGDRFAYIGTTSRCPGCELVAHERDHVPEGQHGYGVKVGLLPRALHEKRTRALNRRDHRQ
ncbi:hypothetical protein [Streptomyces sp. t99]|uniref:hypothetical protein n=1 Tax=Streptomyces sp. t99 TaxID=1828172 RepID=UPI000BFD808B|nr:hypothetical protein [Streptomyces sp. t99]